MSSTEIVRDLGAIAAALGVLAYLLPPPPGVSQALSRTAGLGLMGLGWVLLLGSLVPGDDWSAFADDLASPARLAAAVAGVAIVAGIAWLALRAVRRHPVAWFVLLALALPFRVPVSLGSQDANLLVPLYLVIGLGLLFWATERLAGRLGEAPATPIDLPLALFVAFILASSLWSADPSEAAVKAVFFYLPFVVLFRLVVALWPTAGALRALGVTTVALAVPMAAFAVFQYATRSSIYWNDTLQQANVYSRFFRVNSFFFDPNILGRYLMLALLAAVAIAWLSNDPRVLGALGAAAVIMTAGLWVTFSRSSALGLGLGLALLAWRAFGARRTLAVGGVLLALFAVGAFAASDNVRRAATSTERLDQVSEGRFGLVEGGLEIWRDDPIAGAGLGAFGDRFEETLPEAERRRIRVVVSHNTPVTVLSESGIVGFALFLVLGVATALAIARGSRVGGPDGWAQWTLLAMLAAIAVHSVLYAAFFEDPFTWVVAGAALAIGAAHRAPVGAAEPEDGPRTAPAT
mgnify:CR=1 FL=1